MKHILSPHVSIYKFPITALSSITNRATGIAISGMYIIGGTSLLFNVDLIKHYEKLNDNHKKIIHYSLLFPNIYHLYGGIRHLLWDKYPKLLTNVSVTKSSYFIYGTSIGTTIILETIFNNYNKEQNKNIPPPFSLPLNSENDYENNN